MDLVSLPDSSINNFLLNKFFFIAFKFNFCNKINISLVEEIAIHIEICDHRTILFSGMFKCLFLLMAMTRFGSRKLPDLKAKKLSHSTTY